MRWPAAFCCTLLACIATSSAADEPERPKRHLNHLRAILNKAFTPLTIVHPIGEERIKYIPGLNNVIVDRVPTTPFLKEKVFVNSAPIVHMPPPVRHRLPCPPLPMVRLPSPPPYLLPYPPQFLAPPPPLIEIPPRFAPMPPPPVVAEFPSRFAPIPPPVVAPLPPRFAPIPARKHMVEVLPPPRRIVPVLPEPLPRPIVIPSFKYIYDQKNQDGSITTTYSKDGKDVLVVTTDELPKIPPPVIVDRVEKVVTGLPLPPVIHRPIATGPMLHPAPIIQDYRTPIAPFFRPPSAIKTPLFHPPPELKNKSVPMGTPLSRPPPPLHVIDRLENIADSSRIPNLGYSFKLNNEEGYLQQGDEKIYYSRLLPSPFYKPSPLAIAPDAKRKRPHQYTVITEDKSIFDGIEEGSIRRHHEGNEQPHYGGPHLQNWAGNGYSYKLVNGKPELGDQDSVTVARKIIGTPNPTSRPDIHTVSKPVEYRVPFEHDFPIIMDNTGPYVQRYPFLENTDPFRQRLPLPSDVLSESNKHEHVRPDGTKYICYEIHAPKVHPVLPFETIKDIPLYGPVAEVQKRFPTSHKIEKTTPKETQFSSNLENRGPVKFKDSSFVEQEKSFKDVPKAEPNFLSKNPIVVLPSENNYSYKVSNADGSSIDVTSSNGKKVSVKVNDGKNSKRRGDIPEAL